MRALATIPLPMLNSPDRRISRGRRAMHYIFAAGLAMIAAAIALIIRPRDGESTASFFYAAVIISAWCWGLGPGLTATALAGYLSGTYFINPVGTPGFGWDDTLRLIVFFAVAVLISSLTSLRKRAEMALQDANEQLEVRIARRTSELQQTNTLLRESEERFRLLVEGVADYALVMLDASGFIISWNPGAQRLHGFSHDQVIGRSAAMFYTPDDVQASKPGADLREAALHGRHETEGWRVRTDGSRFWANVITTALRDEHSQLCGYAQVTRDVTELRTLEKELLEISEREQIRIGHDLHDGLGQELTGIALLAQNLRQRLDQRQLPDASQAGRIATLVNSALELTRRLARGFSPVDLGPQGLEQALVDLAAKVQSSSRIPCGATIAPDIELPDDSVALHLYRIAQEAVNNSVRHAQAKHIRIELVKMMPGVMLAVHDDGIGLDTSSSRGKGMGLSVMRYRSRMIGATLEIRSSAAGTSVICITPQQDNNGNLRSPFEEKPEPAASPAIAGLVGG